jgi:hypothetical protein
MVRARWPRRARGALLPMMSARLRCGARMSRDDDRGIRRDRLGRRDAHGSRWRGVGLHDGGVLTCGLRRETRERFMRGDQRADDAERADAPARGV